MPRRNEGEHEVIVCTCQKCGETCYVASVTCSDPFECINLCTGCLRAIAADVEIEAEEDSDA